VRAEPSDRRQRAAGFTLLEVMLALFVLGFGLISVLYSAAQFGARSSDLRDATLAHWVAANVVEELRRDEPWPETGRRRGEALMGTRTWYWEAVINDTDDPDLRRVDVRVFRDAKRDAGITDLTGFSGRTGRR